MNATTAITTTSWSLRPENACRDIHHVTRGIARLSWLGIAGPVDCFNRVFDCYIRVY